MIMQDAWYGHRDAFFEECGDKDEWIDWDYALASALQVIEDMTDRTSGIPVWVKESEWVDVSAQKKIDKFQASIDNQTKGSKNKSYTPEPGETWVPEIRVRNDRSRPTYRDYVRKMRDGGSSDDSNWGESEFGPSWSELQES